MAVANTRTAKRPLTWQHYVCIAAALVMVVGLVLACRQWFANQDVIDVKLGGNIYHSDRQALIELVRPYAEQGMLALDAEALQTVLEAESWIDSVSIRKQWPTTIFVMVTEHTPVAHWQQKGLINSHGEVFYPPTINARLDLPRLFGSRVGDEEELFDVYLKFNALLIRRGLSIQTLYKSDLAVYRVALSNGISVVFEQTQRFEQLKKFVTVFDEYLVDVQDHIDQIDLRYGNGMAVAWRQGSETARQTSESGV